MAYVKANHFPSVTLMHHLTLRRYFLNVVHHAVQQSLRIDPIFSS
ncbi:MAG: hypothetical protein ACW7DY_21420 [Paraglaciecola chathamensis]